MQQQIDFTRGNQLGLLKALAIPDAREIKGATAKSVLRAIDDIGTRCYAAATTLAKHTGLGDRTVKRALRRLEELGFVIPDDRKRKNPNGTVTLTRVIDWTEIDLCVRKQSSLNNSATMAPLLNGRHGATVSDHGATVSDHGATVAPNPPYPQITATTRPEIKRKPEPSAAAVDWSKVVLALKAAGVNRIQAAIDAAKHVGATPAQLETIIDEYLQHKSKFDSPGAIVDRIRSGAWPVELPTAEDSQREREFINAKRWKLEFEKARAVVVRETRANGTWSQMSDDDIDAAARQRVSQLLPPANQRISMQVQT